jgi:aspartyl-tRNA(Asn)/glutamyl-tRNA(Gln) amidotransferase subunit A
MQLHELTILELHEKLKGREVSSVEVARAMLDRVAAVEGGIGAFVTVTPTRR